MRREDLAGRGKHVVLASDAARFQTPFASLGIVPEAASSLLLPARIGSLAATDMLLTGRWVDAEEAAGLGLASRLCRADALHDEAVAVAADVARAPRAAVVATKRLLLAARSDAVDCALRREFAELGRLVKARR